MKYFVSSDIHGFYDEWQLALKENGFDINNPNHKIIVCGDLFDRGHQPKEIIDFVLAHKDKIILIRGNHEDLMEQMLNRGFGFINDYHNGTVKTIEDLCPDERTIFHYKKIAKETGLQEVLDMCVDYYETKNHVFVHGWIPTNYQGKYDKNWRNASKSAWEKARWQNPVEMYENKVFEPDKTIVCGHWHCSAFWNVVYPDLYEEFGEKEKFDPFITKDIIALDTCTVHTRKVNLIKVEDRALKQVATENKDCENSCGELEQ